MGIKISTALKNKLPEGERVNLDDNLWAKSGGKCYLCEGPMNRSSDDIEADHDQPEVDGGETTITNLNLTHASCNRAKRDAKTVDVRPYLRLKAFAGSRRLKYDGFLDALSITPNPVVITRPDNQSVQFELPDKTIVKVPVFSESNSAGTFNYAFLQLPRNAIYNDDACQPRNMRLEHAWAIYLDMQRNVLHEPPSVRTESGVLNKKVKLLMFDGQHKTLASWMMGRDRVTVKVYLDLSTEQANQLVNSIQAKIKKLPLSPFELASKMSDEWENKFKEYETQEGSSEVSERGFLDWLPKAEQKRGKEALKAALVQNILSNEDLRIKEFVKRSGYSGAIQIPEQTLKAKLIESLLSMEARSEKGIDAQAIREGEANNIIGILNAFSDAVLTPSESTERNSERARRMTYQASLSYFATLARQLWAHITLRNNDAKNTLSETLTDDQRKAFEKGLKHFFEHRIWFAQFDINEQTRRFKTALEKNQEVVQAAEGVGLDMAYLLVGENHAAYKKAFEGFAE